MVLRIDNFGRLLIPKFLRQIIQVEPGDQVDLQIDEENQQFSIRKAITEDDAVLSVSPWGFPKVSLGLPEKVDFDVSEYVHSARQEYLDRKLG